MLVYLMFECEIKWNMKFSTLYIYNSSSIIMKTDTTLRKTFPLKRQMHVQSYQWKQDEWFKCCAEYVQSWQTGTTLVEVSSFNYNCILIWQTCFAIETLNFFQ